MKKKGMWEDIGGWFLGLLIVVIIIIVFLGPGKLFTKTKDAVLNFGSGIIPGEKAPDIPENSRVSYDLTQYYSNLVDKIKNSGQGTICWIEIGNIAGQDDFEIYLHDNKIELQKKGKGLTPPDKSTTINGFKSCSVKDEKANRFYYCMKNGIGCSDGFKEDNVVIDKNSKIAPLLFKFDESHICIIYFEGLGTDLQYGCGGNIYSCSDQIKKVYSDCGNPSPPKKQLDECGAVNFCYSETIYGNAHPEIECTLSTPTAFFKTPEDCIKGSKCIKEHSKITIKDCDDSNKETDSLSGSFIWVWPKYFGGR